MALVDDSFPYFAGVVAANHLAVILRATTGSPNRGELLVQRISLLEELIRFAKWCLCGSA